MFYRLYILLIRYKLHMGLVYAHDVYRWFCDPAVGSTSQIHGTHDYRNHSLYFRPRTVRYTLCGHYSSIHHVSWLFPQVSQAPFGSPLLSDLLALFTDYHRRHEQLWRSTCWTMANRSPPRSFLALLCLHSSRCHLPILVPLHG
jgi:hypothetical protein